MKIFYPDGPRPDMRMRDEEKARRARSFRKKAVLSEACIVLAAALALVLAHLERACVNVPLSLLAVFAAVFLLLLLGVVAGEILAFRRCPFCGKRYGRLNWAMCPFLWRFFHCPECDFEPYWDRQHGS